VVGTEAAPKSNPENRDKISSSKEFCPFPNLTQLDWKVDSQDPEEKNGERVDTVRPAQTGQYRSSSPSNNVC